MFLEEKSPWGELPDRTSFRSSDSMLHDEEEVSTNLNSNCAEGIKYDRDDQSWDEFVWASNLNYKRPRDGYEDKTKSTSPEKRVRAVHPIPLIASKSQDVLASRPQFSSSLTSNFATAQIGAPSFQSSAVPANPYSKHLAASAVPSLSPSSTLTYSPCLGQYSIGSPELPLSLNAARNGTGSEMPNNYPQTPLAASNQAEDVQMEV